MKAPHSHLGRCLSQNDLEAFHQGNLPPDRADEAVQHLMACGPCHKAFEELLAAAGPPSRQEPSSASPSRPQPGADDTSGSAGHGQDDSRFSRTTIPGGGNDGSQDSSSSEPPRILGQYRIGQRLGQGGMGAVYRAFHTRLKRWVALKVLPPSRTQAPLAVARFFREMEAIGRLDHPRLVRATDAGEARGVHYLVMDLVDGIDLGKLVRALGPLPLAEACELALQAAEGLACIGQHGLVHRDVKPSNLMLSSAGQLKILDLGLARLADLAGSGADLSGGMVMGTPDYMAPEQWASSHHVDLRADIYSLGCTLHKLLTGRAPFETDACSSSHNKMLAHTMLPPPALRDHRADAPEALEGLLRRMLAKKPEDRHASPAEVMDDLRPFTRGSDLPRLITAARSGTPPAARPAAESSTPRDETPAGRGWPSWPVLLPGLLVVAALALWGAASLLTPSPGTGTGEPPSPRATFPAEDLTRTVEAPSRERVPDVWYSLLDSEPLPLVWPRNPVRSLINLDRSKPALFVQCEDTALLQLGQTTASHYRLEMLFSQLRWGGAGIFFAASPCRADAPGDRYGLVVRLRSLPDAPSPWCIQLQEGLRPPHGGGRTHEVDEAPLVRNTDTMQTLAIEVVRGRLSSASWNGRPIQRFPQGGMFLIPPTPPPPEGAGFGLYCYDNSVTVHAFRFQIQKE